VIGPGDSALIKLGVAVRPPAGCYTRLELRSSAAARGLSTAGQIIDPDFVGEIALLLFNRTKKVKYIQKGSRVCQLIFSPYKRPIVITSDLLLPEGKRGKREGFSMSDEVLEFPAEK
jgi:dUTP pyrophosphatase